MAFDTPVVEHCRAMGPPQRIDSMTHCTMYRMLLLGSYISLLLTFYVFLGLGVCVDSDIYRYTYIHTYIHTHTHIHIYIYVYVAQW